MGIVWGRRDGRRDEWGNEISIKYLLIFSLQTWEFPLPSSPPSLFLLRQSFSLHHPSLSCQTVGQSSLIFTAEVVSSAGWDSGSVFYGYRAVIRGETRWKDGCGSLAKCGYLSWITHKFAIKRCIRNTSGVRVIAANTANQCSWLVGRFVLVLSTSVLERDCQDGNKASQLQPLDVTIDLMRQLDKYCIAMNLFPFMLPRGWTLLTLHSVKCLDNYGMDCHEIGFRRSRSSHWTVRTSAMHYLVTQHLRQVHILI